MKCSGPTKYTVDSLKMNLKGLDMDTSRYTRSKRNGNPPVAVTNIMSKSILVISFDLLYGKKTKSDYYRWKYLVP